MGLLARLSELRKEQIERKAHPYMSEGESIMAWVRARHPDDRRRGLFFATSERALVHWQTGRNEDHDLPWNELRTWGLNQDSKEGPVLAIETKAEEITYVQLMATTTDQARTASRFIQVFAEMAPWPEESLAVRGINGMYQPKSEAEIRKAKRTARQLAKRIWVTVAGSLLIVVGILIIPLPGPWSFLLNIAGLAVLANEYDWADDLLDWTKERFEAAKNKIKGRKGKREKS